MTPNARLYKVIGRKLLMLWLLVSVAHALPLFAQPFTPVTLDLSTQTESKYLAERLLYWADTQGVDAEQALEHGRFTPLNARKVVFGARKHWYLIRVKNTSDTIIQPHLATGLPSTPEIHLHRVMGAQVSETLFSLSAGQPFTDRPVKYPLLFIPMEIPPGSEHLLLLEHKSLANYPLALRFFDSETLQHKMADFTLARGIVFGALLVFLVLFVVQAFASPSRALLCYCAYIACLMLLVGQIFGYNFAYLWPDSGRWNREFTPFISGVTYGFYFLFCATLFNLRDNHAGLYRVTVGLALAAFALGLLNLVLDTFVFLAALALVGLPVPIVIGWWAVKHRLSAATLFLAGSLLHCTLSYLLALECLGVHLGYSYYLFSFLSVGQIFDLTLFSTAILRQASQLRRALTEQLEQRLKDAEALAEAEQARATALAEKQENALALAAAGHDITQPIAAIRFALALVDDDKSSVAKEHMIKTLNYTEELLRTMTQSGEQDYQSATQNVGADTFLRTLEDRHRSAFDQKGLRFKAISNVTEFICMPVVLQRILDNLLVNASRYTRHGGVLLTIRRRKGQVIAQVWDTGEGMRAEQVERLTEPFKQANSQRGQGFGLGLFIVKTLVERAAYSLDIRSEKGRGSCVTIVVGQ